MANETQICIIGNLTADPEIRFTQGGKPVANFTVASTPRSFDKQANEWRDGDPLFLQCSVWSQYAQNVAETLQKGMRVIVHGDLRARQYEHEGQRRTSYEITVNEVGPALRYATAVVTKASPNGQQTQWGQQPAPKADQWAPQQPKQDPWATQSTQTEAPF